METIKYQVIDNVQVVRFTSEKLLDDAIIRQTGEELIKLSDDFASDSNVLLDFEGVTFMSSAMLGKLIKFHKICAKKSVNLKVCSIAADIYEVFKITSLDKMFTICKDQAEAVAAFS